ncbi:hypothetical protein D3C84_203210 [compost metagenome]
MLVNVKSARSVRVMVMRSVVERFSALDKSDMEAELAEPNCASYARSPASPSEVNVKVKFVSEISRWKLVALPPELFMLSLKAASRSE